MDSFNGTRKLGKFKTPSGESYFGQLMFAGENTILKLFSDSEINMSDDCDHVIHGVINGSQRITLIGCDVRNNVSHNNSLGWEDTTSCCAEIFPHFVTSGDVHVEPKSDHISEVRIVINDAGTLFFESGIFGARDCTSVDIERIINQSTEQNNDKRQAGLSPKIAYHTGKQEIFKTMTCIGEISASHHSTLVSSGLNGAAIKNTIVIATKFSGETLFKDAFQHVLILQRFLGLVVGRPQKILSLRVHLKSQAHNTPSSGLEVYSSMMTQTKSDSFSTHPHQGDILINGAKDAENFGSILANWLDKNDEWDCARSRFFVCFEKQKTFDTDRLIAAANMFDILPPSAVPAQPIHTNELKSAISCARKIFKALPESEEKSSLLGALSRVGKSSLKKKS